MRVPRRISNVGWIMQVAGLKEAEREHRYRAGESHGLICDGEWKEFEEVAAELQFCVCCGLVFIRRLPIRSSVFFPPSPWLVLYLTRFPTTLLSFLARFHWFTHGYVPRQPSNFRPLACIRGRIVVPMACRCACAPPRRIRGAGLRKGLYYQRR
ncbi:hypothetical protein C8F01DRAFT_98128 [Mycena amicta]|nr:hypothetical protein C8F01DRAFT_98128 [Mycena amicta]